MPPCPEPEPASRDDTFSVWRASLLAGFLGAFASAFCLRLSFSCADEAAIDEGILRLGRLLRD